MIGKKLIDEKPLPLSKVKTIIEKRKKEGELSYEQNLTLEYVKKFSKLKPEKSSALIKELEAIEKINEKAAIALTDFMPKNMDELRLFFSKERYVLSDEESNKILEVLNKYRG